MGYAEQRGGYFRARYKAADGTYPTVRDSSTGETIKFRLKRDAERAANEAEAAVRLAAKEARAAAEAPAPVPTFGEYVSRWWARNQPQVAESTQENYLDHIEGHLLPEFSDTLIDAITRAQVDAWEAGKRSAGYAASSTISYRGMLHLILQDAIEDETLKGQNPAARRRGRGRRSGRSRVRAPEKVITTPTGALLLAERAAILSGRDDEFVHTITTAYTGMRWGETVGLDRRYVRSRSIRIEAQLYQLRKGLILCPPKDDSYRTLDCMAWLEDLLVALIQRRGAPPCGCPGHDGLRPVFTSMRLVREARISRSDLAAAAGVSAGSVTRALRQPELVSDRTLTAVLTAQARLQQERAAVYEPHWARSDFGFSVFNPAASGWFASKGSDQGEEEHPVAVVGADAQWPGTVVRGRYSGARAEACWMPIAKGLTPHGLRHSHRTWMEELGTPRVLMDERMGHLDGSVSALYAHVTDSMRATLMEGLTGLWEASLTARLALSPHSPVPVLDALLRERQAQSLSQSSPTVHLPRSA